MGVGRPLSGFLGVTGNRTLHRYRFFLPNITKVSSFSFYDLERDRLAVTSPRRCRLSDDGPSPSPYSPTGFPSGWRSDGRGRG